MQTQNQQQPQERQIPEAKLELISLSNDLKSARDLGALPDNFDTCETVNDMLHVYYVLKYPETASKVVKTFKQWKEAGFSVKKGEKGFKFWTSPIRATSKTQTPEGGESEKGYKFFNICYLFSDKQVEQSK